LPTEPVVATCSCSHMAPMRAFLAVCAGVSTSSAAAAGVAAAALGA
jgi:hypothetical protein